MLNLYTYCYNDPVNRYDPSGHVAPIFAVLAYLGVTAVETAPDILLDKLLDGAEFSWWKSTLVNYACNLIPALGETKKGVKIAKIGVKYGPGVVEFIAKHGDDAVKIVDKSGINNFIKYVDGTAPEFSRKLDYVFGKATGTKHNIDRSIDMQRQLNRIGIYDNDKGRQYIQEQLTKSFMDKENGHVQDNGRILKETLIIGPHGVVKAQSVWEGNRLITVEIFGGGK